MVSVKNWRVDVPRNPDELHESTKKRERIPHTNQFRQVSLNVAHKSNNVSPNLLFSY